jgi:hypothetical protein
MGARNDKFGGSSAGGKTEHDASSHAHASRRQSDSRHDSSSDQTFQASGLNVRVPVSKVQREMWSSSNWARICRLSPATGLSCARCSVTLCAMRSKRGRQRAIENGGLAQRLNRAGTKWSFRQKTISTLSLRRSHAGSDWVSRSAG